MPTAHPAHTALRQIGGRTVAAISGGRYTFPDADTVVMPVSSGYRVIVRYDHGTDTYTVQRAFVRSGRTFDKGTVSGIHADGLSDVAYTASCYRSNTFGA